MHTVPAQKSNKFDRWRNKLSKRLSRFLFSVSVPIFAYTLIYGASVDILIMSVATSCLLGLVLLKGLNLKFRSVSIIAIPLLIGIYILFKYGVTGGSQLYFALAVLIAGVLLGANTGLRLLLFTIFAMISAHLINLSLFNAFQPEAIELFKNSYWWTWFVLTYTACTGTALYSISYLIRHLEASFAELESSNIEKDKLLSTETESREKYQLLAENIDDVIWTMDLSLATTYVSPSVYKARGFTQAEAMQHGLENISSDLSRASLRTILETELEKDDQDSEKNHTIRFDTLLRHKSGDDIFAELVISFIRDKAGKPTGILGVTRDITARKKLEIVMDAVLSGSQKKSSANIFQSLTNKIQQSLNVASVFIGEVSDENNITVLALSTHATNGIKISNYKIANNPCAEVVKNGRAIIKKDAQAQFPNGDILNILSAESYLGIAVLDQDDTPIGIISIVDDKKMDNHELNGKLLTIFSSHVGAELMRRREADEKETIHQQLLQSQKIESIGQLAGGIAHDFNNILVVIQGYSELANDKAESDPEMTEFLLEISKAADRAAGLTRQLLSFSRRQIMETKPLNLNSLVSGLLSLLARLLPENIDYQFIPGAELGSINGDAGQLEQAIVNLAVNARDAMPSGGKLIIETENILIDQDYVETHPWTKLGRFVLLRISDTGTGISPEMQTRVFEPFFTTKPEGQGTGLGLSVYFGIVKQHNGFAHLYSELGFGSEFRTYLPIVERSAGSLERKTSGNIMRGSETILLVEDEEQVHQLATKMLTKAGYNIILAEDGEIAIEQYIKHSEDISLVLLDVVLPKLGGDKVMREIRSLNTEVPILFTSGYSSNGIHTNFILEEGLLLLQKPYNTESLLRKVRDVIDGTTDT